MDRIWVLFETEGGAPAPSSLELLTAARGLAASVEALAYGAGAAQLAAAAGDYGASRLYDLGDPGDFLPGAFVAATIAGLVAAGDAPGAVLIASTYDGRDVAARLSVRLDRPVLTNVVGLREASGVLESEHAILGGSQVLWARPAAGDPSLFVVRAKSFAAEPSGGPPAEVVGVEAPDVGAAGAAAVLARHVEERSGPKLDDASVVVSGGRGLGAAENYAMVEELARL
ncbi:MAG: electron transfer flavoprotein subunit alpha/FixB family protein, partial [Acidimicrobiales bacterium]